MEILVFFGLLYLGFCLWCLSDDICRALRAPKEITVNVHFVDDDECCCDCDEADDE